MHGSIIRSMRLGLILVASTIVVGFAAAPVGAVEIVSPGPLTRVGNSPDLNCYVDHALDSVPEFYGTTACGTFAAVAGDLYGPESVPAGGNASPRTAWTPVSQSGVSGSGSGTDPFRTTTVVTGGPLQVSQVDTYVIGSESYRTDATVTNTSDRQFEVVLYRAGDCYLQNSDYGFGRIDNGAPSCLARGPDGLPGDRIEQFAAITGDSHYYHATYSQVWSWIGTQRPFPDTCRCTDYIDNGAGVSWTRTLAPGASVTLSGLITFSPLGRVPISITKTPDQSEVAPGGIAGYTVTVTNPNVVDVPLTALTDDQPPGFAYIAGSTSGVTDADPSIVGNRLTWGPLLLPANSEVSVHYSMRVADQPGTYRNVAGGSAEGFTVIPAEDPPPIDVPADPDQSLVADLYVEKSPDDESVPAGARSGYTITLINSTSAPLRIARVAEQLAVGVHYVPGSTTLLTTDDPAIDGRRLTWSVDTEIPPLHAVKLHFGVRMPLLPEEATLLNPLVTATGPGVDVLPATKAADVVVLPQPILGKTHLRKHPSRATIRGDQRVRFTLTLRDLAPKTATTTTICDRVPLRLQVVSASAARRVGHRLCWVRRLPAGDTNVRVSYVARARAGARGRATGLARAATFRRDPSRARAGVRVLAPAPPAVTG